jgi:hypothetical protein
LPSFCPIRGSPHRKSDGVCGGSRNRIWLIFGSPLLNGSVCRRRFRSDSRGRFEGQESASTPDTEMGPALRPTPLSPACGPRRTLNAWRLRVAAPKGRLAMSPGARAGAGSVGGRMKSEDSSKPLGGSATRLSARFVNWFGNAGHRLSIRTGRQIRPADFAPSRSQRAGSCEHPERRSWLSSLHRAASRRRVECGSKISSSFRVLPRPSEEPIPALDVWRMRHGPESGKRPKP